MTDLHRLASCLALSVLAALAGTVAAAAAERPGPVTRAHALMAQVLESDRGPGLQAAVVQDGRVLFNHAAGHADVELSVAMTPTHRLRIGSVSKSVTATLALRLADAGVLSLDDRVRELITELPEHYDPITLRQLASHTSGIRHYDFSDFAEANNMMYHTQLGDALKAWTGDALLAAPGKQFQYSSLGYNLLGTAIELATRRPFAAALDAYLTGPFGLNDIVVDHPLQLTARRAAQYTVTYENPAFPWMRDGEVVNTIFRDSSDYYPSGGLLASARDLALFVDAVMNGAVLDKKTRDGLSTPAKLADGAEARFADAGAGAFYSLGWTIVRDETGGIAWLGHDGETNGAYALVRFFPDQHLAAAAVANYNVVAREPAFFDAMGRRLPALFHTPP